MKKLLLIVCAALILVQAVSAASAPKPGNNIKTVNHAFSPGEKLTYAISWSNILQAGIAEMEVRKDALPDGKQVYRFLSTARSTGIVSAFYRVKDTVQSIVDDKEFYSLSLNLDQRHGKRKKRRELIFDQTNGTVRVLKDGKEKTYDVPARVQDSLSSLYYVRTREDFTPEKPIIVDVFDSDKTWSVEIYTLGREKMKTRFGELNTIKVRTYPKYEGVFQHTGEICIWFTDDARKIPVLMKSKIAIGSIVATLVDMKPGEDQQ